MKFYHFAALSAAAVLAMAGCNKNGTEVQTGADPDAGLKEITISINGAGQTKAAATPVPGWDSGFEISRYDIYFTSASGVIQYAYTLDADTNSDAFNALQGENENGSGVRFIGLENVSQVYVVANSSAAALEADANISTLSAELENFGGSKSKDEILYVGGDKDLTPIGSEPADNVGATITNGDAESASQYYTADIYLRPVISRLEIGAVHVETSGSKNIEGTDYQVRWTAFQPKLTGIYMSNVYGKLSPVTPVVSEGFARPAGTQITDGAWNTSIVDTEGTEVFNFGDTGLNTNGVLYYSNYSSAYDNLFENEPGIEGSNYYYFNGKSSEGTSTCIPFNFFVPFDVEDDTHGNNVATAVWGSATPFYPAFHFQFDFSNVGEYKYTLWDMSGGGEGEQVTEPDILAQYTAQLNFDVLSGDGFYYANVVQFQGVSEVTPNTIYKMADVGISPFNLTTGTTAVENEYNIIVRVTPVEYVEKDVTPSFDNN